MPLWLRYLVSFREGSGVLVLIYQLKHLLQRTKLAVGRRVGPVGLFTLVLVALEPLAQASARPPTQQDPPPRHLDSVSTSWPQVFETCDVWHPLGCLSGDTPRTPGAMDDAGAIRPAGSPAAPLGAVRKDAGPRVEATPQLLFALRDWLLSPAEERNVKPEASCWMVLLDRPRGAPTAAYRTCEGGGPSAGDSELTGARRGAL
jgi:hypothetical protein